ncbi:UPF0014-domain-containing protein [Rickenella mellea]|uniref:UPF0014-domain-containing protein n=1 Tax=Rickenella mellea TaxID=50990 RepID=A0A4Y7QCW4_9AGAM|nr:UPF0014-domain-containing protein [Rickenella mellea]
MDSPSGGSTHLTWTNVALGFSFIVFDSAVSHLFRLGVGSSLITAGVRCVVQLAVMALVLQKIFEAQNPWGVAGLACLLNLLATFEVVVNKMKRRFHRMFPIVLFGMVIGTIPVAIIGAHFAMSIRPFWKPDQFIPIVGMLCGNTISAVVVSISFVLKEMQENRDRVETYLAFGASRFEACKPVATEALRLALTPTINQMSVLGIISIPGMMTGAILGGSSVQQAARLQMVIMFMITAATALGSIVTTVLAMGIVVDAEHRIRSERIDGRKHAIWRGRDRAVGAVVGGIERGWEKVRGRERAERESLLTQA